MTGVQTCALPISIRFPYPVVPIVRHHHESWDGTGYPDGLRGTDIPLGARILSVVDCFDALTSDRPYRPRLSDTQAVEILMQRRAGMYDPLVVDTFVAHRAALLDEITKSPAGPNNVEDSVKSAMLVNRKGFQSSPPGGSGRPLSGIPEGTSAIRTVLHAVGRETSASLSAVYLKNSFRDELFCVDALGNGGDLIIGTTLPLGARVSGWVAANGTAIINSDPALEWPELEMMAHGSLCIALPLRANGETAGMLVVARNELERFGRSEISFLERVCVKFSEPPLSEVIATFASARALERAVGRASIH